MKTLYKIQLYSCEYFDVKPEIYSMYILTPWVGKSNHRKEM